MRGLVISVFVGALAVACGGSNADLIKARTAFDLSCPGDQVTLTTLTTQGGCLGSDDACATTIGVTGCGKKAVYVRRDVNANWVLNSTNEPSAAQPADKAAPSAPAK